MCTGTGHLVQLVEMCCCSHSLCMYVYRDGALGAACKVFESVDLSGQQYFCYLVKFKRQLRLVQCIIGNKYFISWR